MDANYEYLVLFVIQSETLTLSELAAQVGVQPALGSHSKGDRHPGKNRPPWDSTALKMDSPMPETSRFQDHVDAILSSLPDPVRDFLNHIPNRCSAYLDVGMMVNIRHVFFPHISMPAPQMRALSDLGIELLITMYPGGPSPTPEQRVVRPPNGH